MGRDSLRRWTARSAVLGFLLFSLGARCSPVHELRPETNDCTDMPTLPLTPAAFPLSRKCDQMIAVDSTMLCPSVAVPGGNVVWQGKQLLNGSTGDLARHCLYNWVGSPGKADPNILINANVPTLSDITEDCTFVTPQSWPETFDDWAHDEFVGAVTGGYAPTLAPGNARTRVIVLDTSPDASDVLIEEGLTSAHGETLAHLIQDLACGENAANCATEVKTQLVMPWRLEGGNPNYRPGGGNMGRLSDVAIGMWSEIQNFRQELQNAADDYTLDPANTTLALAMPTRLVFNESFGFGGKQCDFEPANMPEDARALFKTFQAAACLGAAHVAAAGNHTGGELGSSSLLLCPARWDHDLSDFNVEDCNDLFGTSEFDTITKNFKKVTLAKYGAEQNLFDPAGQSNKDALISVGAVDFSGLPIVMTRSNACPEAVALGVGGLGWNGSSATLAPYLFGTSVSAAVVSARAAAQWSQDGQQGIYAPSVFQALFNNSSKIRFETGGACEHLASDICFGIPWVGSPPLNSTSLGGVQNPLLSTSANDDLETRNANIEDLPEYIFKEYQNDHAPICTKRIPQCVKENASAAAEKSNNDLNKLAITWPQPTDPICVRCGITFRGDDWVELWIEPSKYFALAPGTGRTVISSAALVISNALGKIELTVPLDPSVIVLQSVTKIDVPFTDLSGRRAWISAYDEKGNSFSQQIFVIP